MTFTRGRSVTSFSNQLNSNACSDSSFFYFLPTENESDLRVLRRLPFFEFSLCLHIILAKATGNVKSISVRRYDCWLTQTSKALGTSCRGENEKRKKQADAVRVETGSFIGILLVWYTRILLVINSREIASNVKLI